MADELSDSERTPDMSFEDGIDEIDRFFDFNALLHDARNLGTNAVAATQTEDDAANNVSLSGLGPGSFNGGASVTGRQQSTGIRTLGTRAQAPTIDPASLIITAENPADSLDHNATATSQAAFSLPTTSAATSDGYVRPAEEADGPLCMFSLPSDDWQSELFPADELTYPAAVLLDEQPSQSSAQSHATLPQQATQTNAATTVTHTQGVQHVQMPLASGGQGKRKMVREENEETQHPLNAVTVATATVGTITKDLGSDREMTDANADPCENVDPIAVNDDRSTATDTLIAATGNVLTPIDHDMADASSDLVDEISLQQASSRDASVSGAMVQSLVNTPDQIPSDDDCQVVFERTISPESDLPKAEFPPKTMHDPTLGYLKDQQPVLQSPSSSSTSEILPLSSRVTPQPHAGSFSTVSPEPTPHPLGSGASNSAEAGAEAAVDPHTPSAIPAYVRHKKKNPALYYHTVTEDVPDDDNSPPIMKFEGIEVAPDADEPRKLRVRKPRDDNSDGSPVPKKRRANTPRVSRDNARTPDHPAVNEAGTTPGRMTRSQTARETQNDIQPSKLRNARSHHMKVGIGLRRRPGRA